MADGVILSPKAWETIKKLVREEMARAVPRQRPRVGKREFSEIRYLGKTDSPHAKGALGTVQIWSRESQDDAKGDEVDTGETLENVYNRFASLDADTWVFVEFIDGNLELYEAFPCSDRNEIQMLTVLGSPTGGTFDIDLTVNAVTETLTFNWDDDSTEVTTELVTHSEIGASDVMVSGGPFPDATLLIQFVNDLAGTAIALPTCDWSSLTGGTGVAVIPSRSQTGYPN